MATVTHWQPRLHFQRGSEVPWLAVFPGRETNPIRHRSGTGFHDAPVQHRPFTSARSRWTVMEHPLRCRLDTTFATAGAAVLRNGPPATELGPIGSRAVSGPRNVTDRRPGLRDPGPGRERAADDVPYRHIYLRPSRSTGRPFLRICVQVKTLVQASNSLRFEL